MAYICLRCDTNATIINDTYECHTCGSDKVYFTNGRECYCISHAPDCDRCPDKASFMLDIFDKGDGFTITLCRECFDATRFQRVFTLCSKCNYYHKRYHELFYKFDYDENPIKDPGYD